MRKTLALFSLGLILANPHFLSAQEVPLQAGEISPQTSLGWDDQIWRNLDRPGDRQALLRAIDYSLRYLNTASAAKAYQNYPIPEINRDRVRRSLLRFRQFLIQSRSPEELQAAVEREFVFYQSAGNDGQGTVLFTGYFEPIYAASRQASPEYPYPLYRKPANFSTWSKPHPTRLELEGEDGLGGSKSSLAGYELVWLRDRLEAFLVQVQGSAKLQLTDGTLMGVGYDGNTDYPYTSIGKELIKDGIFKPDELTLPVLIDYLRKNPQEIDRYLPRNNRFIFFRETTGKPATGSIGVPVTAERSIATDKSLMPPGALAFIRTRIPYMNQEGQLEMSQVSRYVLDQDTGSAIKGAGRVDIFMGTGTLAGNRAGLISSPGELYYLLLKNSK
jgi:membrane-bound lytic murein transglycosylase A